MKLVVLVIVLLHKCLASQIEIDKNCEEWKEFVKFKVKKTKFFKK
jgi:hypothetical protein